jgi:hypothetical protein
MSTEDEEQTGCGTRQVGRITGDSRAGGGSPEERRRTRQPREREEKKRKNENRRQSKDRKGKKKTGGGRKTRKKRARQKKKTRNRWPRGFFFGPGPPASAPPLAPPAPAGPGGPAAGCRFRKREGREDRFRTRLPIASNLKKSFDRESGDYRDDAESAPFFRPLPTYLPLPGFQGRLYCVGADAGGGGRRRIIL